MPRPPVCSCDHKKVISTHKPGRGLLSENVPATANMGISETVATKLAIDALEKYRESPLPLTVCPEHGPDIFSTFVQLFDVLDKKLFRGVLKGEVYIKWVYLPSDIYGITSNAGVKDTRITIELNKSLHYYDKITPDVFFSIMIHHMTHAYFLACCGLREEDSQSDKHGLGHGLAFCTLLYKISEAFTPKTRRPLNPFNCCPSDSSPPPPQITNSLQIRGKPKAAGSTHCSFLSTGFLTRGTCNDHIITLQNLNLLKQENIVPFPMSHYLHTVDLEKSKFEPVLRKQYPSLPAEYVELHYGNYAVALPRSKLDGYPSLKSKFSESNSTLSIPAPSPSIFFSFYIFLQNGDYPPELVQSKSPYVKTVTANGPPSIATYLPQASNHVLVDVRMFKLASRLCFSEMRSKALERMYSLSETHSDPVILLEEIYNDNDLGSEDDKDELRKWAREFLARGRPGSDLTNIAIFQQSEQWKDRFIGLRRNNGLLNADCDAVTEGLVLRRALERIEGGNGESSKDKSKDKEKEKKKDKGGDDSKMLDIPKSLLLDLAIKNNNMHGLDLRTSATTQPQLVDCLTSSSLSPSELQFLRLRHPSISALYEKILEKEKKSKDDKDDSSKDKKDKGKDKGKEKDKDNDKGKDKDKDKDGKGKEKETNNDVCKGGCSHHHPSLHCHPAGLGREQLCIGDSPCWHAHGVGSPFLVNQHTPMPYPNVYHDQNMNYHPYPYGHAGQR